MWDVLQESEIIVPLIPWQGLSKAYSWSTIVCSVCHISLTVESLPPPLEGGRCRTGVVTAQYKSEYHPALFHTSCLSLCTWMKLAGQQVSMGVDGITLLVTVVCTVFFNSIKPWLLSSTHLRIFISTVFSLKLLFRSIVLSIWCTLGLFNGYYLVGLGFCFDLAFSSFETSRRGLNGADLKPNTRIWWVFLPMLPEWQLYKMYFCALPEMPMKSSPGLCRNAGLRYIFTLCQSRSDKYDVDSSKMDTGLTGLKCLLSWSPF